MQSSGTTVQTASAARQLGPAIPTDTSAILMRLLVLSDEARREQALTVERQIIPRSAVTMLLRA
ncbi:MAG: hypothetical protein KDA85_13330, partial [Planctomycetaceae bacterium]|nr:hypothetical protein [Planctomycetaceae bacterium]